MFDALFAFAFVGMLLTVLVVIIMSAFGLNPQESIIKKAKKIDPQVKTIEEAEFVLRKARLEKEGKLDEEIISMGPICKYCGSENNKGEKKCVSCGASLKK